MGDWKALFSILGALLIAFAGTMILPAGADAAVGNPDWRVFVGSSVVTLFFGLLLLFNRSPGEPRLGIRQAFALTSFAWLTLIAFGALPFFFYGESLGYADAFFESASGLTTTGSTILLGLDALPPGILLWRGLLQWIGGIGIVVTAVAVLPFLQIGGMQLFRAESSDRSEKILPSATRISRAIGLAYLILTLLCALAYWSFGMTAFDALVHAMTTLSTGGFSNFDSSMGYFRQPTIHWTATVFMILGSLPFVLYVRMARGDHAQLWRDPQVRGFLRFLALVIACTTLWLWAAGERPLLESLRLAAFNVTSIVTTTGFATADYESWGQGLGALFIVLTFVGGCTGSTAGAIKIFRFQFVGNIVRKHLQNLLFPNAVVPLTYNKRLVPEDLSGSVMGFFFIFVVSFALLSLLLSLLGLDFETSLSGAATALCNVGPGLGQIIGPAGNFAALPDAAKWVLALGMLVGRLELFTVLVLATPMFWRD